MKIACGDRAVPALRAFATLGLFPEQLPHWEWMLARLREVRDEPPRVLNLFAYTGAASLLAAAAGAQVTHVDASKKAIAWAKENQAASKLGAAPIRWMLDDARSSSRARCGAARPTTCMLVDPPKFGRGPEGEVWDLFTSLPPLMKDCATLLAPARAALVLTVYAIRASSLAFDQLVPRGALAARRHVQVGRARHPRAGCGARAVPTSLFTRWVADAS